MRDYYGKKNAFNHQQTRVKKKSLHQSTPNPTTSAECYLSHARRGIAASELIRHRIQTETPYSLNLVDEAREIDANVGGWNRKQIEISCIEASITSGNASASR